MNEMEVLDRLDERIRSHSILNHPFYVAWQHGMLTRDQLATYAQMYYPHVAAFPGYLESALACTSDPLVRASLERNLADERAVPKPHNELWLDFAEDLGLDRTEVASAPAHPATTATVAAFARLSCRDIASALTALYAYESQQPEVARLKADGLSQHYRVESAEALAYFNVHATADLEHREGERVALRHCLAAGAQESSILQAADDALAAYWGLLDGICDEAGIGVVSES